MTQRLEALDEKLQAKHAVTEAQIDQVNGAVERFKKCVHDNGTRLPVKALAGVEDEDEKSSERLQEDPDDQVDPSVLRVEIDPQRRPPGTPGPTSGAFTVDEPGRS